MSEAGAIGPVGSTSAVAGYASVPDATEADPQSAGADARAPTTAVVEVVPRVRDTLFSSQPQHMSAAFVAHLIATESHFPQTRERRRADPVDATTAYDVVARRVPRRRRY